jgi:hypothetical protein
MSPHGSRRNIVPGVLAPKRVSYRASVGISVLRPRRLRAGRLDSFFSGTGCSAPLSSRSLTVRGRSRDRPSNQNMKRKDAWNCRCSVDLAFVPVIRPKFAVLMSRTGVAGSA